MMKWLLFIAVGTLFGLIGCDDRDETSVCFAQKYFHEKCKTGVHSSDNLCELLKERHDCIKDKAVACKMGFAKEAQRVSEILGQMCKEKESITKLFRQEKCANRTANEGRCNRPINTSCRDESLKYEINQNKKICTQLDFYKKCQAESAKTHCSPLTETLLFHLLNPLFDFAHAVCNEVILPASDYLPNNDSLGLVYPIAFFEPNLFLW